MQLEVDAVLEGKVTGITKFGAFIELPDGSTGMVHISEIANTFVQEIHDFVTEGQTVKVKVLSISPEGKISLSIKKALPHQNTQQNGGRKPMQRNFRGPKAPRAPRPPRPSVVSAGRPGDFEWQPKSVDSGNFEDMLNHFKQTSDEKISDLKKVTENKRGGGGGFSHRSGTTNK